jgi:hypothetical protein
MISSPFLLLLRRSAFWRAAPLPDHAIITRPRGFGGKKAERDGVVTGRLGL